MSERDTRWLLLVFVLVGLFVLYEKLGVDPRFKHIHSISYLAKKHKWLAIFIGVLFVIAGPVGLIWWGKHLAGPIFK